MDCPGCNRSYSNDIKNNTILTCLCGKLLMALKINNKKILADVTPKNNKEAT